MLAYLLYYITISMVFIVRLTALNNRVVTEWRRNSTTIMANVTDIYILGSKTWQLEPRIVMQVKYTYNNKAYTSYIKDRDISSINWQQGNLITIRILRSNPIECHFEKHPEQKPTTAYKSGVVTALGILIIFLAPNYSYCVSEGLVAASLPSLFIGIIATCLSVEIVNSYLEKFTCSYKEIINLLDKRR